MENFQYGNDPEVEEMVSQFADWEKQAMRMVYRFMDGEWDINIHTFLATEIGTSEGWNATPEFCPKTISDYHDYMKGDAKQDLRDGLNASFAIDFIRMVKDSLGQR